MEQISLEEEPPGRTPLLCAVGINAALGLKKVFFKFEGSNVTGTQKDRISRIHVRNAVRSGYGTVSVATCGNYGASIAHSASREGIRSVVMIPQGYSNSRNGEIANYGGEIVSLPGKYEDSVQFMHDNAEGFSWYDASPGSVNSHLELSGYAEISAEIVMQLGHAPEFIAVPVGNGTTLAGIHMGFKKLHSMGRIDRIPRLIASSTSNGNPIVTSWMKGSGRIRTLKPESIFETPVNESLVAYRSFDGQLALDSIRESRGFAIPVSDQEMLRFAGLMERYEKLSVLPASSSALAAASRVLGQIGPGSECVVVITGRGQNWTTR